MTDSEFSDLQSRSDELWKEVNRLKEPYDAKVTEWNAVYTQVQREKLRREVAAELAAEQQPSNTESALCPASSAGNVCWPGN